MTEVQFYAALARAFEAGLHFATDNPNLSGPTRRERENSAWNELLDDEAVAPILKSFEC